MNRIYTNVSRLVQGRYDRAPLLVSKGLSSFLVPISWQEKHCKGSVDSFRDFFAESHVIRLTRDSRLIRKREQMIQEARDRFSVSTNIADLALTECDRFIKEMELYHPRTLEFHRLTLEREMEAKFLSEIRHFDKEVWGDSGLYYDNPADREKLCNILLDRGLGEFGFALDKRLSRASYLVFSKGLEKNVKIGWLIDRTLLSDTDAPELHISLGVFDSRKKGRTVKDELKFYYFFPINELPFGPPCYRLISDFPSQEAIINIYIAMYSCISVALEAAILADLSLM